MKPLLSLSGVLVALSFLGCGRNTPGVTNVSRQTIQNIGITLETEPVDVSGVLYELHEDPYGPQLVDHDSVLLLLLSDIRRGVVKVKKAIPDEGIDRPYIEVSGPQFFEPVLIFPYLDTLSEDLIFSKIIAGPSDYIIAHQAGGATTAKGIVSNGMNAYLSLLGKGHTVMYPVYEEDGVFIRTQ